MIHFDDLHPSYQAVVKERISVCLGSWWPIEKKLAYIQDLAEYFARRSEIQYELDMYLNTMKQADLEKQWLDYIRSHRSLIHTDIIRF
jgi:hypothetical protein